MAKSVPPAARHSRADSESGLSRRTPPYRAAREVAQILVLTGRTNHLHDIRLLRAGSVLSTVGASALLGLFCAITLCEQRHSDADEAKHARS